MIKLDEIIVDVKFVMKNGSILTITTPASDTCFFIDKLNEMLDRANIKQVSKEELGKFSNRYYIFDDVKKSKTIIIDTENISYMEIPYFMQETEEVKTLYYKY